MKLKLIILLSVLAAFPSGVFCQSMEELQQRKKQAEENLKMTSGLISETQETTKKTLSRVNLLTAEIKERRVIINSLNAELSAINRNLSQLRADAAAKQKELDYLKEEYAKMVYHQYYNKNDFNWLMFILSADDLAQSYRRYRYMQQYTEYCTRKVEEIEQARRELDEKLEEVEKTRLARTEVLSQRRNENTKLQSEKNKQNKLVKQLRSKEKELRAELKKQQKVADELNRRIEKLIAQETEKSAGGKKTSDGGKQYALTKEEQLVSGNFEKNQGRLPWPVERGVVVGSFGLQQHPVLQHVTINNKGIYIQCPPGSAARAVFEGEVTQCFAIPGSNNIVIIKHGLYRTVYANLGKVTVHPGDKVSAKQPIGTVYSDPEEDNKTELYFQVWKDKSINNPELWLAK